LIGLPLDRLLIPRAAVGGPRVEIEGEASPAPRGAMAILAFVFAANPAEELVSRHLAERRIARLASEETGPRERTPMQLIDRSYGY
jgi:hypothetical protein